MVTMLEEMANRSSGPISAKPNIVWNMCVRCQVHCFLMAQIPSRAPDTPPRPPPLAPTFSAVIALGIKKVPKKSVGNLVEVLFAAWQFGIPTSLEPGDFNHAAATREEAGPAFGPS